MTATNYSGDIAIIGMSGAFPGARTLDEFYASMSEGREMIRFLNADAVNATAGLPEAKHDHNFVPAVSAMDDIDLFDAAFFGMTAEEAELTDPQHRLLLEHCWRALENAGYDSDRYAGPVGVFGGATINTYLIRNLLTNREVMEAVDPLQLNIANGADFLTTRISYKLNLKGPSHTVQSACSTSLVAVHCGCRSLLDMECDMALAGGISINVNLLRGYRYQDGGIMSPDGHCRVFDANARGTIFGSGVGVVVLKRLQDAIDDGDSIHALIKGSAVNNDGGLKAGYTTPSVEGQAEVVAEAIENAGVSADTISYIECHGTGTVLGDPVEARALTKAFRATTTRHGFCALGSLKSNMGHLDAAAGIAGLIKVVLSLKHGMLLPSLHFQQPNPQIAFRESPFYVNTKLTPWQHNGNPRRAGVSAFGVGGTNAHMVLEEAPAVRPAEKRRRLQLLPVSARTEEALQQAMGNLAAHLSREEQSDLADVAYTLQMGRRQFAHRWAGVCGSREEAISLLQASMASGSAEAAEEGGRQVAFLFPGQGSQYAGMGQELCDTEPVFRHNMQQCAEILKPRLGLDLCSALYREKSAEIDQTYLAQPALFSVEYSLAQLWKSFGIEPVAMLGHSLGEYTAACLSGVMTLEEALMVVAERGRLMQQLPQGGMLAVNLRESELKWTAEKGVSVAAVNAPEISVLAGSLQEIEIVETELQLRRVTYKRLRTSHAFHSHMMEPMMPAFLEEMKKVRLKKPRIKYISNVTGTWIQEEEAQSPRYWVEHLRQPVQFAAGLNRLVESGKWMLLETGPGQSLRRLAQTQGAGKYAVFSLPAPAKDGSETESLLGAAGRLWSAGVGLNWQALHTGERPCRVPLPTYPFQRKRYWIEPESNPAPVNQQESLPLVVPQREARHYSPRPLLRNGFVAPQSEAEHKAVAILEKALGIHPIGVTDRYGELGGDSLTAVRVIDQLNAVFGSHLRVVDLYEGLAVRDLIRHIENESAISTQTTENSGRDDLRRSYQQRRRSLPQTETA